MAKLTIIGHRGAKGLAAENSIESIRAALQANVDAIEIDIRLQNGAVVLSHDPTTPQEIYCPLQQALSEIDGKVPIILDIKEHKAIKPLLKLTKKYPHQLIYSSKKYRILHEIKDQIPDAKLAVIERWSGVRAVAEASLLGTHRIHINHSWLWSKFVHSMKSEGYDLYAYTVNDPERAKELASWGVKGIFTDNPTTVK